MKLMFNKTTFKGHWFSDSEDTTGYTEKVPPHTGVEWNEELNEWMPKPVEIEEIIEDTKD